MTITKTFTLFILRKIPADLTNIYLIVIDIKTFLTLTELN